MGPQRIAVFSLAVLTAIVFVIAAAAQEPGRTIIRVKGSGDVAEKVNSYANEFIRSHPACNIVVSGGARIDWQAITTGEGDMIMASRKILDDERDALQKKGVTLDEATIGYGGIAVIVSPSNPVSQLTAEQVRQVFTGEYETWDKVGGKDQRIAILTIDEKRSGFPDSVKRGFLKAPLQRNAESRSNFHSVISAVYWESNAAGFVRLEDLQKLKPKEEESGIKILAVKKDEQSPAVAPSVQTVDDGSYPLRLPYYLYIEKKRATPLAAEFFQFCAGRGSR